MFSENGSQVVITAQGLGKSYRIYDKPHHRLAEALWRGRRRFGREFVALHDVSFELQRGETLGIIGANGAGKSTLLQILAGTVQPSSGRLEVNGRIAALLELGAGFNPEFTGRENIVINAAILGLTDGEIEARLEDIVAFADISDHIDQPVKTYSSGMYVRLAFSVAAHVRPDILIVDEALAVGDARFQAKCMRHMRHMLDGGATLLFTSHDIGAVKSLCQRCLWLDKGRQRHLGPAPEVTRAYDLDWVRSANDLAMPESTDATRAEALSSVDTGALECLAVSLTAGGIQGETLRVAHGQTVRLNLRLRVVRDCQRLVVSYHLKSRHNVPIQGGHTADRADVYQRVWHAGECVDLEFVLPVYLQHGDYSLTILAASITDLAGYSDAVFHLWRESAAVLQVMVRPHFPLSDYLEPPVDCTVRPPPAWAVLDDFFPNLLTGFRVAEYNTYLQHFAGGCIYSTLGDFAEQHAAYADAHGEVLAAAIRPYHRAWLNGLRFAYVNFLNNAFAFLPDLAHFRVPFVLTLYPGGGFALNDAESDRKLLEVLRSPCLQAIIVTVPLVRDYLQAFVVSRGLSLPPVRLIPGVVVAPSYFASCVTEGGHAYYRQGKETLDVCFVAERYMPLAEDKGYPCFLAAMQQLADMPDLRVHVVGGGYADEERALAVGLGKRVRFYGRLHTLELQQFYRGMDLIVAPNRPDKLHPGAFDGFPTGCCVEASLMGVAVIAADPLQLNPGYADGREMLLLSPEPAGPDADSPWPGEIAAHIRNFAGQPEALRQLATAGSAASRRLYAPEVQMAPRLALWEEVGEGLGWSFARCAA